jgi:Ca2+-binding EF-hand superfamily protein
MAVAVIVARKRREKAEQEKRNVHASCDQVSDARRQELSAADTKRRALEDVITKYDTNKTGQLEVDQIRSLLTDIDDQSPPGTPPTDDEINFILAVADSEGGQALTVDEIALAIKTWNIYCKHREKMEAAMAKFDKSGTGKLNQQELKEYLTDLNDGVAVSDEEAKWVLEEADLLGDGQVGKVELVMATSAWYGQGSRKESSRKVAEKDTGPSSCCCLS